MDLAANRALVRRYVEMWETGNVALADEILAAEEEALLSGRVLLNSLTTRYFLM